MSIEKEEYKELEYRRSRSKAILNIEDLVSIADLALDTNDKKWFKELNVKIRRKSDIIANNINNRG